MEFKTLLPGYLVSLSSEIKGNTKYTKRTIEEEHKLSNGESRAQWETTRTVQDAEEAERAKVARGACRTEITRVCSYALKTYMCSEENYPKLLEGIANAERMAADFNRTAAVTRVGVYVIVGRIAEDTTRAMRAINSDIRSLMDEITDGIDKLDPEAIKSAVARLKLVEGMLTNEAKAETKAAIDAARAIRTAINKGVKAGETAAITIDKAQLAKITSARTAFLDIDTVIGEVVTPDATGRAIAFEAEPVADELPAIAENAGPISKTEESPAAEYDDSIAPPEQNAIAPITVSRVIAPTFDF